MLPAVHRRHGRFLISAAGRVVGTDRGVESRSHHGIALARASHPFSGLRDQFIGGDHGETSFDELGGNPGLFSDLRGLGGGIAVRRKSVRIPV